MLNSLEIPTVGSADAKHQPGFRADSVLLLYARWVFPQQVSHSALEPLLRRLDDIAASPRGSEATALRHREAALLGFFGVCLEAEPTRAAVGALY